MRFFVFEKGWEGGYPQVEVEKVTYIKYYWINIEFIYNNIYFRNITKVRFPSLYVTNL